MGPLGQGLLDPSGIRVVGQLKQGLVSIAPYMRIEPDSLEHESAAPISYRHESTVDTLKNMHALPNKTSLCIKKKGSQTRDV